MTVINKSSILSVFSLVSNAILANPILSTKFNATNIYQLEPTHKARHSEGFPYFLINIPSTDPEKLVFDNSIVPHKFEISVLLRMNWEAKDNVLNYCNAFLEAIADYEDTFQSSGYYDVMVELIDVNPNQVISEKQIVESEFLITVHGQVNR